MEINDSLVNPHLKPVPRLRALTTWSLTTRDTEGLGRHANGTFDTELRLLRTIDEVTTYCGGGGGGGTDHYNLGGEGGHYSNEVTPYT